MIKQKLFLFGVGLCFFGQLTFAQELTEKEQAYMDSISTETKKAALLQQVKRPTIKE